VGGRERERFFIDGMGGRERDIGRERERFFIDGMGGREREIVYCWYGWDGCRNGKVV
jgi:hypothetical protein